MSHNAYKEVGENYRFFAKWRQLAFAGFLTIIFISGSKVIEMRSNVKFDEILLIWLIALSIVGFAFAIADRKTFIHTIKAIEAGMQLESEVDSLGNGFYTKLHDELSLSNSSIKRRFLLCFRSHTLAALMIYFLPILSLLILVFCKYFWPYIKASGCIF